MPTLRQAIQDKSWRVRYMVADKFTEVGFYCLCERQILLCGEMMGLMVWNMGDEWENSWMDRWMDGRVDGWMNRWLDKWVDG